ncbi:MAG: hypothetical protein IT276_00650 [Ignavibacteriaceae bacterium]|nr:hypothetical protein [Ignavibacterium sp.]MCC6253402.1 hypothetical protein [Ignavibacteriaceae bacterium]HRN26648.1 hypothetical protein [Ignavibacteriaceae bacterium]HRP91936.1 hypothetical protein [Ignavibacteriaceae bacterium]HRQ54282.1 hypothetical protein [Ignavibacteriaceae bacterium]
MKKISITLLMFSIIYFIGCEKATDPIDGVNSNITAKEKLNDVLLKARLDFAADAKLSALYGWNVDLNGNVDLLKTDNAFVYVVQSNQLQSNEFYVPVFAAGPIKSPINFSTMLSFIKDSTAGNILGKVFNRLSTLAIDPNANYKDSPAVIDTALVHGGNIFIAQNTGVKIDMFLLPSKSIDTTLVLNNSADWIVNFNSNSKSLVLWINSNSGVVTKLSGN